MNKDQIVQAFGELSPKDLLDIFRQIDTYRFEIDTDSLWSNEKIMDLYLQEITSPGTRRSYESAIKKFLDWYDGHICSVTKLDLNDYFNWINNQDLRMEYRKNCFNIVNKFFKRIYDLFEMDNEDPSETRYNIYFPKNPALLSHPKWRPDTEIHTFKVLEPSEIRHIANILRKKDFTKCLIFEIYADTGMRKMAISHLNTRQGQNEGIDWEHRTLKFVHKGKAHYYPLSEKVMRDLKFYLKYVKQDNSDLIFTSRNGEKLTATTVSRIWKPIRKLIKKETDKDIPMHSMRRTFETLRTNNNQNANQIACLTNHLTNLPKRYVKPTPEMRTNWHDYKWDIWN